MEHQSAYRDVAEPLDQLQCQGGGVLDGKMRLIRNVVDFGLIGGHKFVRWQTSARQRMANGSDRRIPKCDVCILVNTKTL
jgi:hypothetical protein